MSIGENQHIIPVLQTDCFIKKITSFYKMSKLSINYNDIKGIKKIFWKIRVIWYCFRMFQLMKKQQLIADCWISTTIKLTKNQLILGKYGIAYKLSIGSPDIKMPTDLELSEVLKNLDTSNMPKN